MRAVPCRRSLTIQDSLARASRPPLEAAQRARRRAGDVAEIAAEPGLEVVGVVDDRARCARGARARRRRSGRRRSRARGRGSRRARRPARPARARRRARTRRRRPPGARRRRRAGAAQPARGHRLAQLDPGDRAEGWRRARPPRSARTAGQTAGAPPARARRRRCAPPGRERSTGVWVATSRSLTARRSPAAISSQARVPRVRGGGASSARRDARGCPRRAPVEQRGDALGVGRAGDLRDPGERGQRRGDHGQPGGEVLVDLHREDARGERVARVGDQAGVGRAQDVGQLARRSAGRAGGCSARRRAPRCRRAGSPGPTGPTSANDHVGRRRASSTSSGRSSLTATIAPVNTIRGAGSAAIAGSSGPGSSARENSSVSATLGASRTLLGEPPHPRRRARVRSPARGPRARRSAPRPRGSWRCRCAPGRRCRRRSGRPRATGSSASISTSAWGTYAHRIGRCRPSRRAARRTSAGSRRRVERAHHAVAVQRQHQRREHVQAVAARGGAEAASQPARDAREVAPGELRLAQAERLDEQHAVLARQARHQVVLVGPQLGVPVGEADAHDVAAAQAWASRPSAP